MRSAFLAILLAAFSGPAFAAEEDACMAPLPVTAALVREASEFDLHGYAGAGATPAFILGGLSPTRDSENAEVFGSVIFMRAPDGAWRAALPKQGESIVGAFRATNSDAVILLTMWMSEGPGPSWTLVRLSNGAAKCDVVAFPDALNKPSWANEFLALHDLDIAANGRGEIIGVAHTEREGEGERERWYVYATRDGGATWGPPRSLSRARMARAGIYEPIREGAAPAALIAELQAFAASR